MCGIAAAAAWAAGFVVAKHGISIGFSPADLALHRFLWSGLLLMPVILRAGIKDLGGVGWRRGFVVTILSGPTQALLAYTGFILVPLGHGVVAGDRRRDTGRRCGRSRRHPAAVGQPAADVSEGRTR